MLISAGFKEISRHADQRPDKSNDVSIKLPSLTTDTELDSIKPGLLHEPLAQAGHMPGAGSAPASPDFSLHSQEIVAEPTFSLSSTDVSPDKSISGISVT